MWNNREDNAAADDEDMKYRRHDILIADEDIRLKRACVQFVLREKSYDFLGKKQIAIVQEPVWYIDADDMIKHADVRSSYYVGVLCKI